MDFELSQESRRILRKMLEDLDRDGNGEIDSEELEKCLTLFGFTPTPEDVKFLTRQFDENGDGTISIDEIMNNLSIINEHSVNGKKLMQAFKKFDKNNDGFIGQQELMAIFMADGPNQMSREEARDFTLDLFEKFDKDYNKRFSYPEFVRMFGEQSFIDKLSGE